ncbi:MAG: phosphotransferase [bacterium]|nr:phosphotransferase [bacterium]
MKTWADLTEAGQIRRLRPLAMAALEHYPISPLRLRLVGGFTNIIFRVEATEGVYALRIDLHQDHSDAEVTTELAWLEALARDTSLDVCRFIPTTSGKLYQHQTAEGVPGTRRCVLFEWIPGRPLHDSLSEDGYRQLGALAAGLHLHGRGFVPPHQPMVWDRVFYWPKEVDPVVIYEPRLEPYLDTKRRLTLDRSLVALDQAFSRLDAGAAQLIHGDLHTWNVHRYRSRLIALDFEDVTWGHPVQDVAITLFYERDHPCYSDFRAAFQAGYSTIANWPVTYEGELEHFMAARTVMFVNYVANLRDDPSDYYEVAFPRLERFLSDWAG